MLPDHSSREFQARSSKIGRAFRHRLEDILVRLLPRAWYRRLGGFYGFLVPPRKSYSQYGEDLLIEQYFIECHIHSGVYVDIGGFHPRWISNTHRLARKGWCGVVVDLDREKVGLFERYRSGVLGRVGAIAPGIQAPTVRACKFPRLWSEVDTLCSAEAERYRTTTGLEYYTEEIPVLEINEVLELARSRFGPVEFLNVDIEGLDERMLWDLDLERHPIRLICFEAGNFFAPAPPIAERLEKMGYRHLFTSGGSHGYAWSTRSRAI